MYRVVFLVVLSFLSACSQVTPPQAGADIDTQASGVKGDGEQITVSQKLGAVFVVGNTTGALDGEYKGLTDVFLRRYNRDGTIAWRRQIGGDADDRAGGIAVDQNNNVYVGTTKHKPGSPASGNLYKYDSKGNQLWVRRYVNLAGEYEFNRDVYSKSVGVDGNNNVYAIGLTTDSTDFYVRKYGSDGTLKFFKRFDIPYFGGDVLKAATVDRAGNSYINAYEGSDSVPYSYLYKVSPDGNVLWSRLLVQGFTVFSFGDLEVVGDALYGSGTKGYYYNYDADTYIADYDAYVAKYTLNGEKLWGKTIGTSKPEMGDGVSADAQGNVYVTGRAFDNVNEGIYGLGYTFIQKHIANGSVIWKKQFGSETKGALAGIAAYSPTEIYATGRSDDSFPGGTRNSGVLTLRVDGSGKTVWLDQ